MKAFIYRAPKQLTIEDVPKPECGPGDILVKVAACAICGTDIKIYNHGHPNLQPPQTIGHEISGTIAELGKNVSGYRKGDRVTIVTEVGCRRCRFCRQGRQNLCENFRAIGYHLAGGFAEYILIPEIAVKQSCVLPIPDSMSFEEAALVEVLSCVINGQDYMKIRHGESVVVLGAGVAGCLHAELARCSGATKIIMINSSSEKRLATAKKTAKPDLVFSSASGDPVKYVKQETGAGANVVIAACNSAEAQKQALEMAASQGRISLFGGLPKDQPVIELNSNVIHYKELSVFGAFSSYVYQYKQAINLLASRRIDGRKYITHTFPLDRIIEGFEAARSGDALKVIIKP